MGWQFVSRKIHFIGIGGAGMSSMAQLLNAEGHDISGSDQKQSNLTDYLQKSGIKIHIGHDAQNINGCDLIVYSSAVKTDNPEMQKAIELNIPFIRRAEILGQMMNRKYGIAVAGTHGKTTTSAMIRKLLIDAGLDPIVMVGGKVLQLQSGAHSGKGQWFITEADEYDRSFLTLNPVISIVTSIEEDHLDIYKDFDDLKTTFLKFVNQTAFDGLFICYGDQEELIELQKRSIPGIINYGFGTHNKLRSELIEQGAANRFSVFYNSKKIGDFKILLPGRHNILNALAAISVGLELGLPVEKIKKSLASFKGVERRFEKIAEKEGVIFMDDYAHHPTEVKTTLEAARQLNPQRLVAVFQPHLFSRTKDFYKQFAGALNLADVVILLPIYPAREKPMSGVSSQLIFDELQGSEKTLIVENDKIVETLNKIIKTGDFVIAMGAGDIREYIINTAKEFSIN